jgi:hypothetical protein
VTFLGSWLALVGVFAVDAGAPPATRSAEQTSIEWLTALARNDPADLRGLSTFPLLVEGFQSNGKADTNPCGRAPGMTRNRRRDVRISSKSDATFDKMIACVLSDSARDEWMERSPGQGRFKGSVELLAKPEDEAVHTDFLFQD